MDDYADIVEAGEDAVAKLFDEQVEQFLNRIEFLSRAGPEYTTGKAWTGARDALALLLQLATALRYLSSRDIDETIDDILDKKGRPKGWLRLLRAVTLSAVSNGIPRANMTFDEAVGIADDELPGFLRPATNGGG